MYVILTDETNMQPSRDVKFFVYGGLFFKVDTLSQLDSEIEKIRKKYGFKNTDELKFSTATRPKGVSTEDHTKAKQEVIDLCISAKCLFIAHIIHHGIIKNQNQEQQLQWAANYVIGRFHQFLNENGVSGLCLVDSLPVKKQFKYLTEKFCYGLTFESKPNIKLNLIKLFGATCINASHASSAMDIVLGSFRYCINNPTNIEAARAMMPKIIKLMWYQKSGNTLYVLNRGLIIRPALSTIAQWYQKYKPDYDELLSNIKELI